MISSRKAEALAEAAASIDGDVTWFAANAGDRDEAAACVSATVERLGALDILVNNAATSPYFGPLMGLDVPRAAKTVQVNQDAVLVWTQLAWKRGHGTQWGERDQHGIDRRARGRALDRLVQRHQGSRHPPHPPPRLRARPRWSGSTPSLRGS